MTNEEKVWDYLDKAQVFYVTTVDGDHPKCRPFSFKMMANGKIYFGVGTFKDCYRQLTRNPKIEIAASDGKGFIRYYGKAVFDDDPAPRLKRQKSPAAPGFFNNFIYPCSGIHTELFLSDRFLYDRQVDYSRQYACSRTHSNRL